MTRASLRRGWCPGALRPMPTGDGLLARIRLHGGKLSPFLARQLAISARRFGNGLIDLTSRANVQIRGLSEASHAELLAYLRDSEVLDEDPSAEAIRNILASPLAGTADFGALTDITSIFEALDQRLAADMHLRGLPPKFTFLFDDGGWPSLAEVSADLRFDACHSSCGSVFRIALGGTRADARPIGCCKSNKVVEFAIKIAHAFLATDDEAPHNTRLRQCATLLDASLATAGDKTLHSRDLDKNLPHPPIGLFPGTTGRSLLGLGFAFGRMTAEDLLCLADAAEDLGCATLHATPWRVLLMPFDKPTPLPRWLEQFAAQGFIIDPNDPRLALAACPGAPACKNATTPTQPDALRLTHYAKQLSKQGIGLHVSGCAKGCAYAQAAAVTLVAAQGRYGIVVDGKAQDQIPEPHLSIEAVATRLQTLLAARNS
jgi:precorrin-3B synthase